MKQPKPNFTAGKILAPRAAVAREFSRIAKLMDGGNKDEAWRAANSLYGKYPEDGTANYAMALMLISGGKGRDALAYAERAAKSAPNSAVFQVFLGKLYVDLRMIEFAADVLHRAFELDRSQFQAPLALAEYHFASGQGDRALPYYDMALKCAPESSRLFIQVHRADCLRAVAGREGEAENIYRSALEDPDFRVQAITKIAFLRRSDQFSPHADLVRSELQSPGLKDFDRSLLLLCLGRLHEYGSDYDAAFLNFQASRKLLAHAYDGKAFRAEIDAMIQCFSREVFEKFRPFGNESKKLIFVVGMPRSGTTLTEQIIASHSQVEGVGELPRMGRLSRHFTRNGGPRNLLAKMAEVGPRLWQDIPRQYLNLVNVLAPDAPRTVDKMPHNFLHLAFIHLCFPNAKIIHCRRNPLDTFISAFQSPMNKFHSYAYDQAAYGEYYADYLRLMKHWSGLFPDNIYESGYEALTANPEAEIGKMLGFLELPWEAQCLKFNERSSTVRTLSSQQVRQSIHTASVARWRHYEKHLGPIIQIFENAGLRL